MLLHCVGTTQGGQQCSSSLCIVVRGAARAAVCSVWHPGSGDGVDHLKAKRALLQSSRITET
jgi:hypothetical protein